MTANPIELGQAVADVVPWDVEVPVRGCGHVECFDADGHTDGCLHDDSEAMIP